MLSQAVDIALEQKDPQRKAKRRQKRGERAAKKAAASRLAKVPAEKKSRYIPAAVREQVMERAGHRCEFVGRGGQRCQQRTHLEADHIEAFGRGGGSGADNLRCLCRAHNLYCAEQEFGREFVRARIAGGRRGAVEREAGCNASVAAGPPDRRR